MLVCPADVLAPMQQSGDLAAVRLFMSHQRAGRQDSFEAIIVARLIPDCG